LLRLDNLWSSVPPPCPPPPPTTDAAICHRRLPPAIAACHRRLPPAACRLPPAAQKLSDWDSLKFREQQFEDRSNAAPFVRCDIGGTLTVLGCSLEPGPAFAHTRVAQLLQVPGTWDG
jgi:hypothetical protein